jgi:hypothetical protein
LAREVRIVRQRLRVVKVVRLGVFDVGVRAQGAQRLLERFAGREHDLLQSADAAEFAFRAHADAEFAGHRRRRGAAAQLHE